MPNYTYTKDDFFLLESRRGLADFLNIKYSQLVYHIYKTPDEKRYRIFKLNKKRGGTREICAPISPVKIIQRNLNKVLSEIYEVKIGVHGFTANRDIVSNAKVHSGNRLILNVDLKDFFTTINFGRIRGRFKAYPFNFNNEVATSLAQICCYNGSLPQGAPTSPILTNFICQKLDNELLQLCIRNRCVYSRYADDITISTNRKELPNEIYSIENMELGRSFFEVIEGNGFIINEEKVRLRSKMERQVVTGLTVNKFPNVKRNYIRKVRAMLYAWQKFGLEAATVKHFEKYDLKNRNIDFDPPKFEYILNGMISFIGHVKTKENNTYRKLSKQFRNLYPHARLPESQELETTNPQAIIYVEGKTDYKHLNNALYNFQKEGRYRGLSIKFHQPDNGDSLGSSYLLDICKKATKTKSHNFKEICIFDRDEEGIVREVQPTDESFKHWGKGVYSFCLPIPKHRKKTDKISIEQYYENDEIKICDLSGRRLYLSTEFNLTSGRHIENKLITCNSLKPKLNHEYVIDNAVFDENDRNIALTKNDFADNIINYSENFKNISFEEFSKVFDVITQILVYTPI